MGCGAFDNRQFRCVIAYIQFLYISQGSLKELETHLLISQRVELSLFWDSGKTIVLAEFVELFDSKRSPHYFLTKTQNPGFC